MKELINKPIKTINVIIGFIFILIGFCNLTIWGLGGYGYTLSLFIGGLVAFLITFGASGVKELFSKPVKPISNIIKFLLLAIVVSISSAIFLQVIGLKTHGNVILNGGLTPEFFVILPFQMFGEEFLGLFILIVVANLFKGNLIIGNLVSGFLFGIMHYTAYGADGITTIVQILAVQGISRIIFNFAALKGNSIWTSWAVHTIFDCLIFGLFILLR